MTFMTMVENDLPHELKEILDKCHDAIMAILTTFQQSIESSTVPEFIYHYTDDKGLKGILESGNLWLTDIFGLNDPSELKHGAKTSSDAIRTYGQGNDAITLFANSYDEIVNRGLEKVANFFVCSFSKDGNDLAQWRSYADDGRGYVLTFDTRMLEQAFAETGDGGKWGCSAFPMTYNDDQLLQLQKKMIEVPLPYVRDLGNMNLSADVGYCFVEGLIIRLALGCTNASVFYKHPSYMHEKEYRFLKLHRADDKLEGIKFRSRPYRLVRYMEYQWQKIASNALKGITVGPAANWSIARQFAADCLSAYAPNIEISIEPSNIPYRGN